MVDAVNERMKIWDRMQESARCEQAEVIAQLMEGQCQERIEEDQCRRERDREEYIRLAAEQRRASDQHAAEITRAQGVVIALRPPQAVAPQSAPQTTEADQDRPDPIAYGAWKHPRYAEQDRLA